MTLVQDVLCLSIPDEIDPEVYLGHSDESVQLAFLEQLTEMAYKSVWGQWSDRRAPADVKFSAIEWLITADVADVESFQPAHDCADCWMGNLMAEKFLREHPGRYIAMGNISYTPVW